MFLRHPRQVLTREVLLNRVWGFDFDSGTNSLAVYVGYLRRKLEEGGEIPGASRPCAAWGTSPARRGRRSGPGSILASTVAVVIAILAASSASYVAARNTLLEAARTTR